MEDDFGENTFTGSTLEDSLESDTIKPDIVVSGHSSTPEKAKPGIAVDHTDDTGAVDTRSFYNEDGRKEAVTFYE